LAPGFKERPALGHLIFTTRARFCQTPAPGLDPLTQASREFCFRAGPEALFKLAKSSADCLHTLSVATVVLDGHGSAGRHTASISGQSPLPLQQT
jgi:hypothetical protein